MKDSISKSERFSIIISYYITFDYDAMPKGEKRWREIAIYFFHSKLLFTDGICLKVVNLKLDPQ